MSTSENKPCWFRFERDVPEMSAAVGDLLMLDLDTGWVVVCSNQGRYVNLKHEYLHALCAIEAPGSQVDKPRHPSTVSKPITAPSDLSALFELIRSSGGKMPGESAQ